jgi:hypothetical protein
MKETIPREEIEPAQLRRTKDKSYWELSLADQHYADEMLLEGWLRLRAYTGVLEPVAWPPPPEVGYCSEGGDE